MTTTVEDPNAPLHHEKQQQEEERDGDEMLTNNTSFSRRRSIAWAIDILNSAASLEEEEVDKNDSITIESPPRSSWQDIKGFVTTTAFGDNEDDDKNAQSDEDKFDEVEIQSPAKRASWGASMLEILEFASLGFDEEAASVVPGKRGSSTSSGMSLGSMSETMKEFDESFRDLPNGRQVTLEAPAQTEGMEAEQDEQQFDRSAASLTPLPVELGTIKEEGTESSRSMNLQTNPQDPPSRTRRGRNRPKKMDDLDWKSIQKIIKDKKVLTSAGVRNLVLDSLKELPSMDPEKKQSAPDQLDPEMVKMREALARFTITETGRDPSITNQETSGFLSRLLGRILSDLSDECDSKR